MILAKAKLALASQLESTKWVSNPIFWRQQNVASIQLTSWANSCKKITYYTKNFFIATRITDAGPGRLPIILYNQHLDINQNKTLNTNCRPKTPPSSYSFTWASPCPRPPAGLLKPRQLLEEKPQPQFIFHHQISLISFDLENIIIVFLTGLLLKCYWHIANMLYFSVLWMLKYDHHK